MLHVQILWKKLLLHGKLLFYVCTVPNQ